MIREKIEQAIIKTLEDAGYFVRHVEIAGKDLEKDFIDYPNVSLVIRAKKK